MALELKDVITVDTDNGSTADYEVVALVSDNDESPRHAVAYCDLEDAFLVFDLDCRITDAALSESILADFQALASIND